MRKKKRNWLFILIFLVFSSFTIGEATEVRQVETIGEIGFTGVYEPIGTPDPTPPESIVRPPITDVAKPEGLFPQTNDTGSSWFFWAGIFIISIVFLLWKQKRNQQKNKLLRKQE
ncbi:LPXTG cell wall anchor domain-containing protein [Enterococcus casseliflavus]|nr:LPXTG cell wall anchor domain-containing protein [Enterococcus casseliflavus]